MADVWANVNQLDTAAQERLAAVLESRGADPQQQAMRRAFLDDLPLPRDAHVLDVGCGTGVLTRLLARLPAVAAVVGVDTAASLLERARHDLAELRHVSLQEADARSLPFGDGRFDVVAFDSTLSHIVEPEQAVAEAQRVLRPGGHLAVFDGDYATTTVALRDHDPLQACVDAMMANSVTDRWLMRRLRKLVSDCGLQPVSLRSFGFTETGEAGYMTSIVERGADMLSSLGQLGNDAAAALKTEARRRLDNGTFYGHIGYVALIARKP